ncbi:TPA: hypothetical protein ACN30P_004982, partial [Vibrio parahaemolyticus]
TGLASKVKSFCVYWFLFLALHLIKRAFHVRSGGTICQVFALILPLRFLTFGRFLWCGFFRAEKFAAKPSFSEAAVKA